MQNMTRLAVCAFVVVTQTTRGQAQSVTIDEGRVNLVVDVGEMSDSVRSVMIRGFAMLRDTAEWQHVRVQKGDNLKGIVEERFGFDEAQQLSAHALQQLITSANGIDDPDKLREGKLLSIPLLPRRPYANGANSQLAQFLGDSQSVVSLFRVADIARSAVEGNVENWRSVPGALASGATWIFRVPSRTASDLLHSLSEALTPRTVVRSIYVDVGTSKVNLESPSRLDSSSVKPIGDGSTFSYPLKKPSAADSALQPQDSASDSIGKATAPQAGKSLGVPDWSNTQPSNARALSRSPASEATSASSDEMLETLADSVVVTRENEAFVTAGRTTFRRTTPTDALRNFSEKLNKVRTQAQQIQSAAVGHYYVMDFYGKRAHGCGHGGMVMEVARQVLDLVGAPQLAQNIVPLELDFHLGGRASIAIIDDYIASQTEGLRIYPIYSKQAALADKWEPTTPRIPGIYMQALYYKYLLRDPTTWVMSTSAFQMDNTEGVFPLEYPRDGSIPILAAVLDVNVAIEAWPRHEQPLRYFYNNLSEYPFVLVGAESAPGIGFGMFSDSATGVTTVAPGGGWGSPGTCIQADSMGTSFATPAVGTLMFLARALQPTHGSVPRALSARLRLLEASDIAPALVGRYGSAGFPNPQKLFHADCAFAIDTEGNIIDLDSAKGYIKWRGPDQDHFYNLSLVGGGFAALSVVNGNAYVLRVDKLRWEKLDVLELHLSIREGGIDKQIDSLAEFSTHYQGVYLP